MSQTINDLMDMAERVNGRAKTRLIGRGEANEMLKLVKKFQNDTTIQTIRVYSFEGFVPNSYKYRAEIRYFWANRKNGKLEIGAGTTDAKRSHGLGSLVTINNRAYGE